MERLLDDNPVMVKWDGVLIMILKKGTYINIWDYSQGKGPGKAVKQVIPFEGNEKSFETILKQLNR